jgi:hypothetical protein
MTADSVIASAAKQSRTTTPRTLDCVVAVLLARTGNEPPQFRSRLLQAHSMKQPAVCIMANKRNGTLYTGVTSNLLQRVHQHRKGLIPGFSSRYGCTLLVCTSGHDECTPPSRGRSRLRLDQAGGSLP